MGLDMYAIATKEPIPGPVDFKVEGEVVELHYWRKHPDLHGWMERLYRAKGGTETFNCTPVQLTAADLDDLERVVRAGKLPHTTGFFFGRTDGSEQADDLAFIAKAREALADGWIVFYDSWW